MSQVINVKLKGRFTSFNELSEVPEGALLEAKNVNLDQDSIAEPRRGFNIETGQYSDVTDRTQTITEFQDHKIAHHGDLATADTLSYLSAGSWSSIGTVSAISGRRLKFVGANQNLYFTSSIGVRGLEAYNGTSRISGAYKGLDLTASTSASASTWLPNLESVAYRVVWLYKDANSNLLFGAPSQRESYTNSSGSAKAIDLAITIPSGITTSWFLQIYRSASLVGTPSDELGLVYEANPTAGEITAKSMTVIDIVPDSLRGATIYTASSQEGLAQQNELPPMCEDIDTFRDCVFFGNTTSKHRFYLTVIATGGSNGVTTNDTLTIGGVVYTAKASETIASAQFKAYTSATDPGNSAAQNIALTAQSIVRVVNQYTSSTVYAYYLSGPDDLPGKILLEERSIGGASFPVISSRATCWNPSNIPTSGTTQSSSNDRFANGLYWSKPNQPETAPLVNFAFIGSKNDEIMRIKALRDALYIFKEGGQVFKLTGYYPNFQIDKIEDSVKMIARESLQVLNNQIYLLSDQGVVVLSDSTKVISRPIEQEILAVVSQDYSLVQSAAFGLSYESERKYYLFLPDVGGSNYATYAHVFNTFTNTWVKHVYPASCGFVDSSSNFYVGDPNFNGIKKERKTYTSLDYADWGFETSITDISSLTITLDSGIDEVEVGDVLYQTETLFATVDSVDYASQSLTIDLDPGLTEASVTVLKAINTQITWVPVVAGNPGIQKQFHTLELLFKRDFSGNGSLGFMSDLDSSESVVSITGNNEGIWGLAPWGEFSWGGDATKRPLRQWIPRTKQRSSQLTCTFYHVWGFSHWQLAGISVFGELGSESGSRE